MEDFVGVRAVVTGAGSGIGRALSEALSEAGAGVAMLDYDRDRLAETVQEMSGREGRVIGVDVDVSDYAAVEAAASRIRAELGPPSLVVANAGVFKHGRIGEFSIEDWQWTMQVNLFGVINTVQAFLPDVKAATAGHVAMTASMGGFYFSPDIGAYTVSKQAVVAFGNTLRVELKQEGSPVGVSVVCPGYVNTNIVKAAIERGSPAAHIEHDRAMAKQQLEGMSAREAADIILSGIRANRPYIFTHPEMAENCLKQQSSLVRRSLV